MRFSSPSDQAAFFEQLSNSVAELVSQYHDESADEGRWFRFTLGSHPALVTEDSILSNASTAEQTDD